jgi:hypothetical protein
MNIADSVLMNRCDALRRMIAVCESCHQQAAGYVETSGTPGSTPVVRLRGKIPGFFALHRRGLDKPLRLRCCACGGEAVFEPVVAQAA